MGGLFGGRIAANPEFPARTLVQTTQPPQTMTEKKTPEPEPQTLLTLTGPDAPGSTLSVPGMIHAFIKTGVTAENVNAFEKLVEVYERTEAKAAEREFAAAFARFQSELPPIQALRPVPNNDGSVRYRFAPFEDIMERVKPLLEKHGFTLTFSMGFSEGRVVQNCTLTHTGGHSRTNQFMARIGKGPPGSTETQGDGAASTYAKRFALCDALNIVIERDSDGAPEDARKEGEFISPDHIQYLEEQLRETGFNRESFLRLAGVSRIEEISLGRYPVLVNALEMKKGRK
jgi:hypothetical protein